MNVLERLRSDMQDAGWEATNPGEDPTDACLAVLDEFIAAHEVVEVDAYVRCNGHRMWDDKPDSSIPSETIIVPRDPEPTLLAAAGAALAQLRAVQEDRKAENWEGFDADVEAFAAAIKKEEER